MPQKFSPSQTCWNYESENKLLERTFKTHFFSPSFVNNSKEISLIPTPYRIPNWQP